MLLDGSSTRPISKYDWAGEEHLYLTTTLRSYKERGQKTMPRTHCFDLQRWRHIIHWLRTICWNLGSRSVQLTGPHWWIGLQFEWIAVYMWSWRFHHQRIAERSKIGIQARAKESALGRSSRLKMPTNRTDSRTSHLMLLLWLRRHPLENRTSWKSSSKGYPCHIICVHFVLLSL